MSSEANSSTPVKEKSSDVLNNKMLGLIVKQISDKGLEWDVIASEMPVDKSGKPTTVAAVKERWRRYKISQGLVTVKPTEPGSSKKPASKGKAAKRKAGDEDDAGEDVDEEDVDTPKKKKVNTLVKTSVKITESDGEVSDQTPVKPKSKPKKASAPKKTAASSAKKASPAKVNNEKADADARDSDKDAETKGDDENKYDNEISVESEKGSSPKEEESDDALEG